MTFHNYTHHRGVFPLPDEAEPAEKCVWCGKPKRTSDLEPHESGDDYCWETNKPFPVTCTSQPDDIEAVRAIVAERDRLREQNNRLIEAMLDIAHDTDDCVSPGMKHLALRALGEKL